MNILHIVGGLPTPEQPHYQPFIKSQIDSLIQKGLNIEVLDLKGYQSPLNYFRSIKQIKNIVAEKKINLIHAHYVYCGLSALLANTKLPLVLSLMGSDLLGSPDESGKITLRGKLDRFLSKIASNYADWIIVKSAGMKAKLKTKIPVSVVPNGVNFDEFKPINKDIAREKLNLDKNKFFVLFLGNPKLRRKNFPLAKSSFDFFNVKLGNSNCELLTPFGISHDEVKLYLNACNVLLVTSFWEGSPNVVKEAMACNLPIISTDVGDVREIINETTNCFIVQFNSNDAAEKLELVYKNAKRSNGREMIGHLKDEIIAEEIIGIYKNVISNSQS